MPRCPDCRRWKPSEEFPRNRSATTGRGTYCKPCFNQRARTSREKHHGTIRQFWLDRRYGVFEVEIEAILEEQGHKCAICGTANPTHVDHDHATGAIRGVLCFACNRALGFFQDDMETISRAIDYVEGHSRR